MRFDCLQQGRVREKERREHLWRVVKAVVGSLVAGGCRVDFRFRDGPARCALGPTRGREWATHRRPSVRNRSKPAR